VLRGLSELELLKLFEQLQEPVPPPTFGAPEEVLSGVSICLLLMAISLYLSGIELVLSKNYLPVAQIRVICKNGPQVSIHVDDIKCSQNPRH
jgi:hypothetical protein